MSANRILFVVLAGLLVLLVAATLALSGGTPAGAEGLSVLVQTIVGVGLILIVIRLVRAALRR
jgi:hypothetical protein